LSRYSYAQKQAILFHFILTTQQNKAKRHRSVLLCRFVFLRQKNFFSDTMRKRVRLLNNFNKQCEKIEEKQRKFEQKKSPSDGYFV